MATTKVNQTYYDATGTRLSPVSQIKLFNILVDDDNNKFLNIFKSYTLNDDVTENIVFHDAYQVENEDYWDSIADRMYRSTVMWWLVAQMNNVVNPFEELNAGEDIKILKEQYVYQLIRELQAIEGL